MGELDPVSPIFAGVGLLIALHGHLHDMTGDVIFGTFIMVTFIALGLVLKHQ